VAEKGTEEVGHEEEERKGEEGAPTGGPWLSERGREKRKDARAARLGQGGCRAVGKREKRKEEKWAARARKQAQEGGGGEGQAGLRAGLADFSFSLSFSSFLFQTNSILFEFK
jgi:hypothetical protein